MKIHVTRKIKEWLFVIVVSVLIGTIIYLALALVVTLATPKPEKLPVFKDSRFESVEYAGSVDGRDLYIIRDTETDVKYILCLDGGPALSPFIEPEAKTETVKPNVVTTSVKPETTNPIDQYKDAARYLAKTVYGEARGCSTTEQAAVIWCILNRVDQAGGSTPNDIVKVVTARSQFHGYQVSNPVTDEHYNLAIDVLTRWLREKNGETNVGRVLPKNYLYFYGDGKHNHFRDRWDGGNRWDWRLKSPYGEV